MPLRADFEIKVTETAQLEWNNTVKATFVRDGDEDSDIFVIDRFYLTSFLSSRGMPSLLLTNIQSHSYRLAPNLISPLSTDMPDRRDDQGAAGRLGMMRVAGSRVRT